jgi:hypothetical protein
VQHDRVTGAQQPDEAQERLDALRRRLYREGATEEDVLRYAERRDAQLVAEEGPAPAQSPPRRRGLRVGAAAAALVAVLIGVVAIGRPGGPLAPTRPTASSTRASGVDIGDGQVLSARPDPVAGPEYVATSVAGFATIGQRFSGTGAAVVRLDVRTASFDGGRILVSLSPSGDSPAAWRALRSSGTASVQVVARSTGSGREPDPSSSVFLYRAAPPTRVFVDVEDGVAWTLLVGFTSGTASDLH